MPEHTARTTRRPRALAELIESVRLKPGRTTVITDSTSSCLVIKNYCYV